MPRMIGARMASLALLVGLMMVWTVASQPARRRRRRRHSGEGRQERQDFVEPSAALLR